MACACRLPSHTWPPDAHIPAPLLLHVWPVPSDPEQLPSCVVPGISGRMEAHEHPLVHAFIEARCSIKWDHGGGWLSYIELRLGPNFCGDEVGVGSVRAPTGYGSRIRIITVPTNALGWLTWPVINEICVINQARQAPVTARQFEIETWDGPRPETAKIASNDAAESPSRTAV